MVKRINARIIIDEIWKNPKCQTFSMSEEWFLFSRSSPENDAVTESPSRLLILSITIPSIIITIIIITITRIFIWKTKFRACFGKLKSKGNYVYFHEWRLPFITRSLWKENHTSMTYFASCYFFTGNNKP